MPDRHKTLQTLGAGEKALVVGIDGGRGSLSRLEGLGLLPGVEVKVLANADGPLLVCVGETRIIVERGVARKVRVL